jgi:glutamate racemase
VRIGVFDSGLGGLAVTQAIISRLPEYDYLYLGDTKRVPYGNRSQESIHEFVSEALAYLFAHDCEIVILACNTASAEALRKSQQEYLPVHYPTRRVLGVLIPTVEAVFDSGPVGKVGLLATQSTVESGAYQREAARQNQNSNVVSQAAPLLVPLIENGGKKYLGPILDDYLAPLIEARVDTVVLGCTHYSLIKEEIRSRVAAPVLSQDEIVPDKLADYLHRHPELESRLGRSGTRQYQVTDLTAGYADLASLMAGQNVCLDKVSI